MDIQENKQRNISFDLLRIIAAFSVVMLHVSGVYIEGSPVGSIDFGLANFMNSISRFGVPVFVMISGAIILSEQKQVTIKKLWTRNIFRMVVIFSIWSFAYYVYQSLYWWDFDFWKHGIVRTITGCVYASDHFWFIFMIIGLYALVPFLRTWLHHADKKELDYFVILFVVFQIGRTTITTLIDKSLIEKIFSLVKSVELSWYVGYFVIGYILVRYGISARLKIVIYSLVPVGVIANYVISDYMSKRHGAYSAGIYDSFGVFTFIHSVALFVFFVDKFSKAKIGPRCAKVCTNIALDTLGIYLMHVGLLDFFKTKQFIIGSFPTVPGILLLSFACFAISAAVAAALRRIPFIGKYLC